MELHAIVGAYFPVFLLVIGLIFGIFVNRNNRPFAENYIRWFLFFSVGIMGFWAGLFQAFEPEKIAASIGWANSPFLFEVACVNIGFGVAGVTRSKIWTRVLAIYYHCPIDLSLGRCIWPYSRDICRSGFSHK